MSEASERDYLHALQPGAQEVGTSVNFGFEILEILIDHVISLSNEQQMSDSTPRLTGSVYRLLDKLLVICPNSDSCSEVTQRGQLEDHLRYRCEGTLVACQYAGAGCEFRAPIKKVREHQLDCPYKKEGESRLLLILNSGETLYYRSPLCVTRKSFQNSGGHTE